MSTLKRILTYLNPIVHLGERDYSLVPSLISNIALCILSEVFVYGIAKNPMAVGAYIIFLNVGFIIYFAFRYGIRGGFISSLTAVLYYFYIIYTRQYQGEQLSSGIITTVILGVIYLILAIVIGFLKQTIDQLIEREANEKRRLQAILLQLPVGVVITDNKGRVTQANKQIENIMGVKVPIGYMVGQDRALVRGMQNNKPATANHSPLYHTLKTGKSILGREFTIFRKDGKKAYIQISSSIILDQRKKPIAAAAIINDVTQQKEMELRKDDFLNMASHELKTPITSMKLYIEYLVAHTKNLKNQPISKTVDNIKLQIEKLQMLINDLLDVSRLQTGKLTFSKEKFRLDLLIKEAVESIQGAEKGQRIIFENPASIQVSADRFRIYQVLTNLIANAIKYSETKKNIRVRIKKSKGNVVVSVQDFGIGISQEEQRKIFERLYQVAGDKEKTFPGFGMGLYISKEIIRRHHGKIWVKSQKGKGSTFYFSLPT